MGGGRTPLITLQIDLPVSLPIKSSQAAERPRGPHLSLVTHDESHLRVHGGWPQVAAGGEGILPDNAAPTHRHLTAEIVPHGHLHRNRVVHITKAVGSGV